MIKAGQIAKGHCLIWKGEPYLVTGREFVNPGKGAAFVRVKLKGLQSGKAPAGTISLPVFHRPLCHGHPEKPILPCTILSRISRTPDAARARTAGSLQRPRLKATCRPTSATST